MDGMATAEGEPGGGARRAKRKEDMRSNGGKVYCKVNKTMDIFWQFGEPIFLQDLAQDAKVLS